MGAGCNKLLLPLAGRPVLSWTLDSIKVAESIDWIGIIGQPIDQTSIMTLVERLDKPINWINGGSTRQESVQRGLAALPFDAENVLIHDGARCLAEPSLFNSCAEAVKEGEAVIAATPVTDTIKRVDSDGIIVKTPIREGLWAAQTPQGFSVKRLREAHLKAIASSWSVTDDASLFERLGWPVKVLESSPSNIKVTTPFDLTIAEAVLRARKQC